MYRKTFGIDYMERELERLGEALDSDVKIYLIGGGRMLYRDAKAATKDVDMVVTDPSYLTSLSSGLKKLGYGEIKELPVDYRSLGASIIMKNEDGFQFDVFYKKVCNNLSVGERMVTLLPFSP